MASQLIQVEGVVSKFRSYVPILTYVLPTTTTDIFIFVNICYVFRSCLPILRHLNYMTLKPKIKYIYKYFKFMRSHKFNIYICIFILGVLKSCILNAWGWSARPKHVAYIDETNIFFAVHGRKYVNIGMIHHNEMNSTHKKKKLYTLNIQHKWGHST
jgi:hypothetical protein